jgi:uncharacterized protein YciI
MLKLLEPLLRRGALGYHAAGGGREGEMPYFVLFYDVVDDYVTRRASHREEHLRLAREAHRRGELLLAGALSDPVDGALLVFCAPDRKVAEDFARNDPYVLCGVVTRWEVRPWSVVVGGEPPPVDSTGTAR